MDIARFRKKPVMGILRGVKEKALAPLIETVISAGLETLEIAMNTPGAAGLIRHAAKAARGRLMLGAGTVLTAGSLKEALDAGATFIVSPTLVPEVVGTCLNKKIPVFPGAFTAQEIYTAWKAGATMVKVFPAKFLGPAYIREIKGPLNDIELLACGGVTPETIQDYLKSGASAVAFGGSVFRQDRLAKKDFGGIGDSVKALISRI